jgi:hypothetical protein
MNSMKSPWLTGCEAISKSSSHTVWRGVSLSNANPAPPWPICRAPPPKRIQLDSRAWIGVSGHVFW